MAFKSQQKPFGGGKPPSQRDSKICPVCGLPFSWRKKWVRDWENVTYCSERCRREANSKNRPATCRAALEDKA